MATIINPITTVLMSRPEFESGEFDRFPFKYILESNGTITYYSKLNAGRWLFIHEAAVPGLGVDKKTTPPKAEFQALAHGNKIPGEFFYQIKQFFLDVMDMGPSTYEAQVFVVWNETTKDYRIIIPEQTVSAAAVKYDIKDQLADDDVIILDIHSHNTMGAFFSGTDDRDDKKNPWVSGVFGKLNAVFEHKFRFNDGCGRHLAMKAEDVFDFEDARFQTPAEWLAQVKISTPVRYTKPAVTKTGRVDTWDEAFGYTRDSGNSSFRGGTYDSMDELEGMESLWGSLSGQSDVVFTSPEDDMYDLIIDSLDGSTPEETINIIDALLDGIKDSSKAADNVKLLTDREAQVFMEIDFGMRAEGNLDIAASALTAVRGM